MGSKKTQLRQGVPNGRIGRLKAEEPGLESVKVVKNPFVDQDFYGHTVRIGQDKKIQSSSDFSIIQQDDSFINESRKE